MKNPYIIAEIGINHNGRINDIKKLIFQQKIWCKCGKFQLFKLKHYYKDSNIKSLQKKKKKPISNVEKLKFQLPNYY